MPLTFIDIERQKNWRIGLFFLFLLALYLGIAAAVAVPFLPVLAASSRQFWIVSGVAALARGRDPLLVRGLRHGSDGHAKPRRTAAGPEGRRSQNAGEHHAGSPRGHRKPANDPVLCHPVLVHERPCRCRPQRQRRHRHHRRAALPADPAPARDGRRTRGAPHPLRRLPRDHGGGKPFRHLFLCPGKAPYYHAGPVLCRSRVSLWPGSCCS